MLILHGSPISNYYTKVKLALLEKGVPFTEAYAATHSTAPGKVVVGIILKASLTSSSSKRRMHKKEATE